MSDEATLTNPSLDDDGAAVAADADIENPSLDDDVLHHLDLASSAVGADAEAIENPPIEADAAASGDAAALENPPL